MTPPKYFWDTSCFISFLAKDPGESPHVFASAQAVLRDVERGAAVLITSTIVTGEILKSRTDPETYQRFVKLLENSEHIVLQDVDAGVMEQFVRLREAVLAVPNIAPRCTQCGRPTDTPRWADMVLAATALVYEAELAAAHSLDPRFNTLLGLAGSKLRATAPAHPSVSARQQLLLLDP